MFHHRRQSLAEHLCHGPFPLQQACSRPLSCLDPGLESPQRLLFLDTETTGLAGGSGTYAFLVGLAYFEQGHLHLEQLIMREHCEERAMLSHLVERLEWADCLVTFNGKTFDVPLLQTRLMMNRLRFDLEDYPHLDLLPISRRLWSTALENCKLETLEEQILGLPRHGDVPGWMVPQIFFRFLQSGDARGLGQVAEHNRRDILSMVGLLAGLWGYVEQPQDWTRRFRQQRDLLHLEDLALAQLAFRRRDFEVALPLLERVWTYLGPRPPSPALRLCGGLLARCWRRLGQLEPAQEVWRQLAGHFPRDAEVLEQVAKQHEHAARDYPGALHWVEQALQLNRLARGRRKRLQHRRQRLLRKLVS